MMHTSQDAKDKEINILQKGLLLGQAVQSSTLLTWELSSLIVYPFLVYNWEPYALLPSLMLGFWGCQVFVLSRLT